MTSVKRYIKHARNFGDARSVFETAQQDRDLSAKEVGYLVSQLRRVKPILENAGYWVGEGRGRRLVNWPKFQLSAEEREHLARRLLAEDVERATIARYLSCTPTWIRRLAETVKAEREAKRLIANGPIDLLGATALDSQTDAATYHALRGVLGLPTTETTGSTSSANSAPTTPINTRDAKPSPAVGDRFGRLTVLALRKGDRYALAEVQCSCTAGSVKTIRVSHLQSGSTKSCGCRAAERAASMRRSYAWSPG